MRGEQKAGEKRKGEEEWLRSLGKTHFQKPIVKSAAGSVSRAGCSVSKYPPFCCCCCCSQAEGVEGGINCGYNKKYKLRLKQENKIKQNLRLKLLQYSKINFSPV